MFKNYFIFRKQKTELKSMSGKIYATKEYDVKQKACLHFPHKNFDQELHPSLHEIMKGFVNWTLSCPKINKGS